MLGAVNHQGSQHVPKSQLSSKRRLFRTGWQNPDRNNKPTQAKQPPNAAAMEKPHFQDINSLQKWLGECLGMQVPHKPVLKELLTLVLLSPHSHSAGWGQLWRVVITGCDLSGQSSTRNILPALQWGRLYKLYPISSEAHQPCWTPGFMAPWEMAVGLCRASRATVLGKMDHASLALGASHCS